MKIDSLTIIFYSENLGDEKKMFNWFAFTLKPEISLYKATNDYW